MDLTSGSSGSGVPLLSSLFRVCMAARTTVRDMVRERTRARSLAAFASSKAVRPVAGPDVDEKDDDEEESAEEVD